MAHAKAMISRAEELGVEVLAITDHHSVDDIATFRTAARGSKVTIFPGFELTTSENVHLLCIFDPSRDVRELDRALGALGVGEGARPSALNCLQAMDCVHSKLGGIVIAAHAMNGNGLLRVLEGQACIDAWRSACLSAIQVPAADTSSLDRKYRRILENKDPNYRREPERGKGLALAQVLARDVTNPDDLAHEAATCWLKMGSPTLDGLRIALLDPDDRVALREPVAPTWIRIERIRWSGGFLDGQSIRFGPNLNVLIGGRGTGKSTVIESLRFVLGLEPSDHAQRARRHQAFVRGVLQPGGEVCAELTVKGMPYVVSRTVGEAPSVTGGHGEPVDVLPSELLPGIEIFSQRELSDMAREATDQVRLLDRYLEDASGLRKNIEDLRWRIGHAREELEAVERELARKEQVFEEEPRLREQKLQLEQSGLTGKLQDKRNRDREETHIETARARIRQVSDAVERLSDPLPLDRAFVAPAALKELPHAASLVGLDEALASLERAVQNSVNGLHAAIESARGAVDGVEQDCAADWKHVDAAYQATLRELQRERFDGSELIQIEKRLAELQAQAPTLEAQRNAVRTRRERLDALLLEWKALLASRDNAYQAAARKVGKALPGLVRATVHTDSERIALWNLVREHVRGRLDQVKRAVEENPDLCAAELAEIGRQGPAVVEEALGCSPNQAELFASGGEALWRDLESLAEPLEARIELNVGTEAEPVYQQLDNLSDGQRATALLLIVLGKSAQPLIIDQPEDDLDNHFIVEGIVERLRCAKTRRQVVVATHNPNLPVLGDCELLVPMKASVEAGQPRGRVDADSVGAIDEPHARRRVEELLEGGRRAFETRRERYGY